MTTPSPEASRPATATARGARRASRVAALSATAVVAVAVVAACTGPAPTPAEPASGTATGSGAAPAALDFRTTTVDGAAFDGTSLRGKPAVLWFWAAWCTVCAGEAPAVAEVAAANPGVRFVGVSAHAGVPAMKQFVADRGVGGFTQLDDADASVWRRFGVVAQPAQAFLTAAGDVRVVHGPMSEQQLAEQVSALTNR